MKRIYINNKLEKNLIHQLDYEQFIHLSKVVRLKAKDELLLFNNLDGEWLAVIEKIGKKQIEVKCVSKFSEPKSVPNIDLLFSPIKYQNSETIIRQGTEIGIRKFYPTVFSRTVADKINMKKFNTYALSASQQSGRTQIPEINEISKIEYQKDILNNKNILMFDENLEGKELGKISINLNQDILIIIGPEGGFSDKERMFISSFSKSFHNLKIGSRILKADTAVVSALSLVFHYFDRD
jgi:16S rRNA (uracil1498-N3)-methyltransferase|tara:strand:+ start:3728 stop:4441 length:714 start_codon:yes stop_codon:yes gene_type:complete